MSEIKTVFFGLRVETMTLASMLFDKTVNHYASLVKKNFAVRKPLVIDGKRVTEYDGDEIASHIIVSTSGNVESMAGSVYVDPSNERLLLDARRYENYSQEHGVGPFRTAIIQMRDKEKLQKALSSDSGKPGIKDALPDLQVH